MTDPSPPNRQRVLLLFIPQRLRTLMQRWDFIVIRDAVAKQKVRDASQTAHMEDAEMFDDDRQRTYRRLKLEGILLTMFDDRTNLARQVAEDLRDFFGNEVLTTVIPRSIRLAEAPSYGKPILMYDPRSKGAESYIRLAKEILENERSSREATQGAG